MIARADNTGLGNQTWEVHRHLKPAKTLLVDLSEHKPAGVGTVHPERFTHGEIRIAKHPITNNDVDWLLTDIDKVYTAETGYHRRFFESARQRGVESFLHYNYEFLEAGFTPSWFAAPTTWNYGRVDRPNKFVLQMPVALDRFPEPKPCEGEPTFLHIVGKPAVHDRNGTNAFLRALNQVGRPVRAVVTTQTGRLDEFTPAPNVDLQIIKANHESYWELYEHGDVLVSPRRFGGLHLPALEALGAGMPVVMPDLQPNETWTSPRLRVPARRVGGFRASQTIDLYDTEVLALASVMRNLLVPGEYERAFEDTLELRQANSWDAHLETYQEHLC